MTKDQWGYRTCLLFFARRAENKRQKKEKYRCECLHLDFAQVPILAI
jgi:hypothetical protein